MIVVPRNPKEWHTCVGMLSELAGVAPSADMKIIAWVNEGELALVVGFNGFVGKLCQIHVAMKKDYHFTPRAMLEATFDYCFNQLGRERLIGVVNSRNLKALRYDEHLGFKENHRMEGMHDEGGDLIIMTLDKADCKYLTKKEAA